MTQQPGEPPLSEDPPQVGWVIPARAEASPVPTKLTVRRRLNAGAIGALVYLVSGVALNTFLIPGSKSLGLVGLVVGIVVAGSVAPARSTREWLIVGSLTFLIGFAIATVIVVVAVLLGSPVFETA